MNEELKNPKTLNSWVWAVTFSNTSLWLARFAPTNSQLSLNPTELMYLLPSSAMSFFASLSNLSEWVSRQSLQFVFSDLCWGTYFVAGSSNDAISTMDPSSMLFRKLMRGFTSAEKNQHKTHQQRALCIAGTFNVADTYLRHTCQSGRSLWLPLFYLIKIFQSGTIHFWKKLTNVMVLQKLQYFVANYQR